MIVVDASVLATALSDDGPDGTRVRMRLDGESALCAPEVIDLELAMAWRRQLRDGRLDVSGAQQALDDLETISLTRAPHQPLMPRIWELRENLTSYDAAYVALAEKLEVTLLTADRRSTRAPRLRCEIEVLK
ncbi:MAG TPA: type II toxin-antitoxin system VapC family toxin [Solirubrobacteraceae bacterium]|nr:type II toxin-antitoxin system VapC family toxin [Solirubrobacteraceae bacterium]